VGQAFADALGFVVEGRGPAECAAYVRTVLVPRRLAGPGRGRFPLGQYSDDTQLARELVLSLVRQRRLDPADYASRIATLFTQHRVVGRGRATTDAAQRIADGVPWDVAGTPAPAAGNGSAMRAAPIGLFFWDDPHGLVRAAHDQGRITHQDRRCSAGAIAIAGATAIAVRDDAIDPASLCASLSRWTADYDPVLTAALEQLPDWIRMSPAEAVRTIAPIGMEPTLDEPWPGISPFVTPSVLWSLYSVLRSPTDYWESICTAIAVGGDVDTTAAMAGAIAGAAVGLRGVPGEALGLVTDQGEWRYAALVELAYRLHAVRMSQRPLATSLDLTRRPDPG
jgi:ADP-ribosylglycohydrolase